MGIRGEGSGGKGEGSGGKRGREVGIRGREVGNAYPPVHPLSIGTIGNELLRQKKL